MSYGKPVISSRFGSNREMAKGAMICLDDITMTEAFRLSKEMPREEYLSLVQNAIENDRTRTWERYAEVVAKTYRNIIKTKSNSALK